MATRLTVYMDPYGRFFLSACRGAYAVDVELDDGLRVQETAAGGKMLVGPTGASTEVTDALRRGLARLL